MIMHMYSIYNSNDLGFSLAKHTLQEQPFATYSKPS